MLARRKYGRWAVIGGFTFDARGRKYLFCECACGTRRAVGARHLESGASRSCGCRTAERVRTHGRSRTREHRAWERMLQRCFNSRHQAFDNYGGRGISVCRQWRGRAGFARFFADMGVCPPGLTLDRKNNEGNYTPTNCRWATRTEQNRNTRRSKLLTFRGETLAQSAWAERLGIGPKTIEGRLARGWTIERTLTAPINPNIWRSR